MQLHVQVLGVLVPSGQARSHGVNMICRLSWCELHVVQCGIPDLASAETTATAAKQATSRDTRGIASIEINDSLKILTQPAWTDSL